MPVSRSLLDQLAPLQGRGAGVPRSELLRALGRGQRYGLSARGLAVDTALMSGEEFPRSPNSWIERPDAQARELRLYALLDHRATGAYRFVLKPGLDTVLEVRAQLFLRQNVAKLGLAPLTSMYYFGENHRIGIDDFGPKCTTPTVCRSRTEPANGSGGRSSIKRLLVTSFAVANPLGFRLQQRDRSFAAYETSKPAETRPSVWIEPKGKWGAGRIELVQIPTPDETNDNIVAFFSPDVSPQPQQPLGLEYRMLWQKDNETRPTLAPWRRPGAAMATSTSSTTATC